MVKKNPDAPTAAAQVQVPVSVTGEAAPSLEDVARADLEQPGIPVPSGITGSWFPALVVLPGQRVQLPSKVRVYAAPEGLYIYDRPPQDQAQVQSVTPLWYAPIAYDETSRPPANYSARAANGFGIATTKGVVTITVPKGCPTCGVRAMAVWQPVWAHAQVEGAWKGA